VAIRWDEFLNNLERYKKALPPDEPIVLPRREAKRRAVNKEKKTRVVFTCTPEQFAAFHTQLKRYRDLVPNVTMSTDILIAFLAQPSDGDIQAVAEEVETGEFAAGLPKDSIGE
jgi:hypothetical protein